MRADLSNKNVGGGIYIIDHDCGAAETQTVDLPAGAPDGGYAIACMGATNANGLIVESCSAPADGVITVTLSGVAGANDDLTVIYYGSKSSSSSDN
tara:strand:- start:27 stop:314 length:288 start_codon:yes stop_codon:yes gene_type:complete